MSPLTPLVFLALAGPRVLVLNLEPVGVEPAVARAIDPVVLNAASIAGVSVIAETEIKKMADVEASKAELGCDTSSCLAELAGAMGAELVLFGSVTRLGSTTTVNLSLFDSRSTQVDRDAVSVEDVGQLPRELPPRVHALVKRAHPEPAQEGPQDGEGGAPSALFLAGGGALGLGALTLLGGGAWLAVNEALIQDPSAAGADKRDAQTLGRVALGIAAAGAVATAVGALLLVMGVGGDA